MRGEKIFGRWSVGRSDSTGCGPLQLQLARQKIVASIVLSSPALLSIRWSTGLSLYHHYPGEDRKGWSGSEGRGEGSRQSSKRGRMEERCRVSLYPFPREIFSSRALSLSLSRLFFPLLLLLFPFLSRLIVQHEGRRKGRGERRSSLVRTNERRSFGDVPRVAPDAPPLPVPYICKSCRPIVSLFTLPLPLLDKKIQVKLSSG